MARSISIDPLSLHDMSLGDDNTIILHDSTKSDKEGENLVPKHVHANPENPLICPSVALGTWLALNQQSFELSEQLFRKQNSGKSSASQRCCENLVESLSKCATEVKVCVQSASGHGIRKGSATSVSSGTT